LKIVEECDMNRAKFSKVLERLMVYFEVNNLKDLSKKLKVKYPTLSTWIRRDKIPYELLINLAIQKNISLDWLLIGSKSNNSYTQETKDKNIIIDSFVNKNHKNVDILGFEEHVKDKYYLSISRNIIDMFLQDEKFDELKMVTVIGSSMSPTINSGDKVFISYFGENEELYNSIVYLVVYKNRTYIKRIQVNPITKSVRLISDNDKYEPFEITEDKLDDFKVIGRVIFKCSFREVI